MAIGAPTQSSQYTNYAASPSVKVQSYDWNSKIRMAYAKLTFTAAGYTTASAGDLSLIRMPAGKIRVLGDLSRVICPAGTATSDLDIGWAAYTNAANASVSADQDGFAASLDVGGGAINAALASGSVFEFESNKGFDIVASFDTANSPASGDFILMIAYQIGN